MNILTNPFVQIKNDPTDNIPSHCARVTHCVIHHIWALQVNLFQKLATSAEHVVYQNCSDCQNKNNNLCTQHVLTSQFS